MTKIEFKLVMKTIDAHVKTHTTNYSFQEYRYIDDIPALKADLINMMEEFITDDPNLQKR